jgi:hypothetical protein
MKFEGPGGAMMLGPEMPMFRKRIEPLLRGRLNNLPNKIMLDMDEEPFDIDLDNEIEEVPPAVIRDLVATAIRDAQSALKRLAADGVV